MIGNVKTIAWSMNNNDLNSDNVELKAQVS